MNRTVYESGPLAGRGAAAHAARLVTALAKQYPARAFEISKLEYRDPGTKRKSWRIVVARKKGA